MGLYNTASNIITARATQKMERRQAQQAPQANTGQAQQELLWKWIQHLESRIVSLEEGKAQR